MERFRYVALDTMHQCIQSNMALSASERELDRHLHKPATKYSSRTLGILSIWLDHDKLYGSHPAGNLIHLAGNIIL